MAASRPLHGRLLAAGYARDPRVTAVGVRVNWKTFYIKLVELSAYLLNILHGGKSPGKVLLELSQILLEKAKSLSSRSADVVDEEEADGMQY